MPQTIGGITVHCWGGLVQLDRERLHGAPTARNIHRLVGEGVEPVGADRHLITRRYQEQRTGVESIFHIVDA